jgi:hypothetical protein
VIWVTRIIRVIRVIRTIKVFRVIRVSRVMLIAFRCSLDVLRFLALFTFDKVVKIFRVIQVLVDELTSKSTSPQNLSQYTSSLAQASSNNA